jgi:hypothetical protein
LIRRAQRKSGTRLQIPPNRNMIEASRADERQLAGISSATFPIPDWVPESMPLVVPISCALRLRRKRANRSESAG